MEIKILNFHIEWDSVTSIENGFSGGVGQEPSGHVSELIVWKMPFHLKKDKIY